MIFVRLFFFYLFIIKKTTVVQWNINESLIISAMTFFFEIPTRKILKSKKQQYFSCNHLTTILQTIKIKQEDHGKVCAHLTKD